MQKNYFVDLQKIYFTDGLEYRLFNGIGLNEDHAENLFLSICVTYFKGF